MCLTVRDACICEHVNEWIGKTQENLLGSLHTVPSSLDEKWQVTRRALTGGGLANRAKFQLQRRCSPNEPINENVIRRLSVNVSAVGNMMVLLLLTQLVIKRSDNVSTLSIRCIARSEEIKLLFVFFNKLCHCAYAFLGLGRLRAKCMLCPGVPKTRGHNTDHTDMNSLSSFNEVENILPIVYS